MLADSAWCRAISIATCRPSCHQAMRAATSRRPPTWASSSTSSAMGAEFWDKLGRKPHL